MAFRGCRLLDHCSREIGCQIHWKYLTSFDCCGSRPQNSEDFAIGCCHSKCMLCQVFPSKPTTHCFDSIASHFSVHYLGRCQLILSSHDVKIHYGCQNVISLVKVFVVRLPNRKFPASVVTAYMISRRTSLVSRLSNRSFKMGG